jgi:hypothetical protein
LSNFLDILNAHRATLGLNAHRATLGASMTLLEQQENAPNGESANKSHLFLDNQWDSS